MVYVPVMINGAIAGMHQAGINYLKEKQAFTPDTAVALTEDQLHQFAFSGMFIQFSWSVLKRTPDKRFWYDRSQSETRAAMITAVLATLVILVPMFLCAGVLFLLIRG